MLILVWTTPTLIPLPVLIRVYGSIHIKYFFYNMVLCMHQFCGKLNKIEFWSRSYQSKQVLPNLYAVGYMERSEMERWLLCWTISSLIHSQSAMPIFLTYWLQTNRNNNLLFSPTQSLHLILSCSHLHRSPPAPHLSISGDRRLHGAKD